MHTIPLTEVCLALPFNSMAGLHCAGHAAAGPGTGIELTQGDHKGRLMFIGHRGAYVEDSVWYTDDGGKTYTASQTLLPKMDEAQSVAQFMF